jgi:hypothetical protein
MGENLGIHNRPADWRIKREQKASESQDLIAYSAPQNRRDGNPYLDLSLLSHAPTAGHAHTMDLPCGPGEKGFLLVYVAMCGKGCRITTVGWVDVTGMCVLAYT